MRHKFPKISKSLVGRSRFLVVGLVYAAVLCSSFAVFGQSHESTGPHGFLGPALAAFFHMAGGLVHELALAVVALGGVASIVVYVSRRAVLRRAAASLDLERALYQRIGSLLHQGTADLSAFLGTQPVSEAPLVIRVLRSAISAEQAGSTAVQIQGESELLIAEEELRAWAWLPGMVASNAPYVGLVGTVSSVMLAIQQLGGSAASRGAVNSAYLLIADALVATAFALVIAIPSMLIFENLNRTVGEQVGRVKAVLGSLVATLQHREAFLIAAPAAPHLPGRG